MINWRRSGGCNNTTPRCRSRNIANNTFSEGWLQFADGASQPPCKEHCKYHVFMQNAAKRRFWDHTKGGGGGSERRTGIIYRYVFVSIYVCNLLPHEVYIYPWLYPFPGGLGWGGADDVRCTWIHLWCYGDDDFPCAWTHLWKESVIWPKFLHAHANFGKELWVYGMRKLCRCMQTKKTV